MFVLHVVASSAWWHVYRSVQVCDGVFMGCCTFMSGYRGGNKVYGGYDYGCVVAKVEVYVRSIRGEVMSRARGSAY